MRRSLIVVVVLVACGDDGGSGVTPSDYIEKLRDAQCQRLVTCGMFPSLAECQLYFPIAPDPSLVAAVDSGASTFNAGAAADCIAASLAESCDYTAMSARQRAPACDLAVTGNGATGAPCAWNSECVSDRCAVPSCQMACCIGSCVPPVAPAKLGESCVGRDCEAGLACANSNTCVMPMPAGSACMSIDECDFGLACAGGTSSTCQALAKLGEACSAMLPCTDLGAGCIGGTCKPLGLPGDACTVGSDCSPYYICDTTSHVCALRPALGQACMGLCGDGSWCEMSGGPGTCVARKPVGDTCASFAECQSNYCDTFMHVCSLPAVCI